MTTFPNSPRHLCRRPDADDGGTTATPTATAGRQKVCRVCGADLAGHRRYKDKDGYLCKDCHELDKKRRLPCAECGKPTAPENLKPWGPVTICQSCFQDHEIDPKKRFTRKVSTRHFDKAEKQKLVVYGGIVGALVVTLLVSQVAC